MRTSESIVNLSKALLKAQKNMGAAVKGSSNPYFKSKYADLGAVMEAVKQEYNDNGVLVLQPPVEKNGKNYIETALIHAESGEFMISETEVICSKVNDPQSFGAAQTYARRFGLQSMTFTPAEDDDGNSAAGRTTAKPTKVAESTPAAKVSETVSQVAKAVAAAPIPTPAAETKPLASSNFKKTTKKAAAPTPAPVAEQTESTEGWN